MVIGGSVVSNVTQEDIKKIITNITVNNMLNCTQLAGQSNIIIQTNAQCKGDMINKIVNTDMANKLVLNLSCLQSAENNNVLTEDITTAIMAKVETVNADVLKPFSTTRSNLVQIIRTEIENLFTTNNVIDMFQAYSQKNQAVQVNTQGGGACTNFISGLNLSNVSDVLGSAVGNYVNTNKAAINITDAISADVKTKSTQTAGLWALAGVLLALAIVIGVALIGTAMLISDVPMAFMTLINPMKWCR